jgi:hypothetical protein
MFSVERLVLQPRGPDELFVRGERIDQVGNRLSEGVDDSLMGVDVAEERRGRASVLAGAEGEEHRYGDQ